MNWTGERCGLIDTALGVLSHQVEAQTARPLRACGIRHACRWFAQHGKSACAVCPLIVTEVPHSGA
jgi:hypothetical protein